MIERPAVTKARRTVAAILAGASLGAAVITGAMLGVDNAATTSSADGTGPSETATDSGDDGAVVVPQTAPNRHSSSSGQVSAPQTSTGGSHTSTRGS